MASAENAGGAGSGTISSERGREVVQPDRASPAALAKPLRNSRRSMGRDVVMKRPVNWQHARPLCRGASMAARPEASAEEAGGRICRRESVSARYGAWVCFGLKSGSIKGTPGDGVGAPSVIGLRASPICVRQYQLTPWVGAAAPLFRVLSIKRSGCLRVSGAVAPSAVGGPTLSRLSGKTCPRRAERATRLR